MNNDPYLLWPEPNPPNFNQILSDESLRKDSNAPALCRLFYNTDIRRLYDSDGQK